MGGADAQAATIGGTALSARHVAARQGKHELAVTDLPPLSFLCWCVSPDGASATAGYAFYRRGLVHQPWAKLPLAIQDLEQAITLDPQFSDALFALGQLRFQAREFAPAEQAFSVLSMP
jgi:tetratricopeptide (TPR) repeat protein